MVEVEEGGGGYLGEERFEDGWVGGEDDFKEAEDALVGFAHVLISRGGRLGGQKAGGCLVPEEVLLGCQAAHAFFGLRGGARSTETRPRRRRISGTASSIQLGHAEKSGGRLLRQRRKDGKG